MAETHHTLTPDTARRMVRTIIKSERDGSDRRGRRPRWPVGGGASVLRLTYVSMDDDTIVCEDDDEQQFIVAKPEQLRRTPFDGELYKGVIWDYSNGENRIGTQGSETETNVIVPSYGVGDELFVITADTGVQVDDEDVNWLDLNVDGRAWAKEAD